MPIPPNPAKSCQSFLGLNLGGIGAIFENRFSRLFFPSQARVWHTFFCYCDFLEIFLAGSLAKSDWQFDFMAVSLELALLSSVGPGSKNNLNSTLSPCMFFRADCSLIAVVIVINLIIKYAKREPSPSLGKAFEGNNKRENVDSQFTTIWDNLWHTMLSLPRCTPPPRRYYIFKSPNGVSYPADRS